MIRTGLDFWRSASSSGSCHPPTRDTKARRVLSGDHTGWATPLRRSVSRAGSPPSAGMTYNCAFCFGTRSETKASREPSGDQRGAVSRLRPVVKRRGSPPAVSTTQMLDRYSSRSSESVVTTKATSRPSGESCGSLTNRIRVISCGVMARRLGTVIAHLHQSTAMWQPAEMMLQSRRFLLAHTRACCRPYSLMCEACHPSMLTRQCQTCRAPSSGSLSVSDNIKERRNSACSPFLMGELRNALARGIYTAYPLFGMHGTVVPEAVEEPLAQKDAWACCPS